MPEQKAVILLASEIENLSLIQNRLAASLIEFAKSNDLAKGGDWAQGGWSRSSDKIDIGWRVAGALQEKI